MTSTGSAPHTSDLAAALADDVLERLLRYVRIDTQSDPAYAQSPSTPGQLELGRLLVEELRGAGLTDVAQDANGFVFATLPGNVPGAPVIGLLAHLDTSPGRVRGGRRAAGAPGLRRRADRAAARRDGARSQPRCPSCARSWAMTS